MASLHRCFITSIDHVSIYFMGFRQSTRLQERIAPFLVRNLPQGLQVPPEELREARC
jgi:hypothetical protein